MKPLNEFSLEHIWPDRLGGRLSKGQFKTRDVCERCNNIAGLFVDAPFIKSFFHLNDNALAVQDYVDPRSVTSVTPFSYMAILEDPGLLKCEICELWLGPCGEQYYHVHHKDDPRWDAIAGGDPIARNRDPGRVYAAFTTPQQDWVNLSLRSMRENFPAARRYGANVQLTAVAGAVEYLHHMDAAAATEAQRIISLPLQKSMRARIDLGFEHRFMAKLGIALGYKIMGELFLRADYTAKLRRMLWEKDYDKRAEIGLAGSSFLDTNNDMTGMHMAWRGGYTIWLRGDAERFSLSLYLPSTKGIHLVIADQPALWSGLDCAPYRKTLGVCYVIVPQIGEFVGPLQWPELFAHRFGNQPHPDLQRIEAQRIDPASLPPRTQ